MAKGVFERELKRILQGDLEMLDKVIRTCNPEEKRNYMKVIEKPFIVSRAAGSRGIDLLVLRGDIGFPIEVKSSKYKTLRTSSSKRLTDQADNMEDICDRTGLVPIYAYRLKGKKGDAWRLFTLPVKTTLRGQQRTLYNRLSKAKETKNHLVLKWEDGFPLNKLIDLLC